MQNLKVNGKRVLVRVDFNVPLDKEHRITDDTRIRAAIPSIKHLLNQGACVILMSHLGRPQKKLKADGSIDLERFTLRHIVNRLSQLLGKDINFVAANRGHRISSYIKSLNPGDVALLENTRFDEGERKNDPAFSKELSQLANIYINDAFGSAHRAHASTHGVAQYFDADSKGFGLLMQKEIENANKVLNTPKRPVVAITGGAKVSDKLLLLEKLIEFADTVIIGGGMAYTFFKANGGRIGNSLCEEEKLQLCSSLQIKAKKNSTKILLPIDSKIGKTFANDTERKTCASDDIPDGWMGLDIGSKAIDQFKGALLGAGTIIWNGPMGVFEFENFADGTKQMALAVAKATDDGAFSLIGGGDSVAAIQQMGLTDRVSFASTGGGAMLEYLEGNKLPGIEAIENL